MKGFMANRYATPVSFLCLENETKGIFGRVSFGSTGAPTIITSVGTPASNPSKGVLSITRSSAGLYVIKFGVTQGAGPVLDKYIKLLDMSCVFDTSGISSVAPAAPLYYLSANTIATAGQISIQFTNVAQTATDPASGEILRMAFVFGDSST